MNMPAYDIRPVTGPRRFFGKVNAVQDKNICQRHVVNSAGWQHYLLPRHPKSFHCIKHLSATKSEDEINRRNVSSFKKRSVAAHLRSHLADNPG